MPRQYNTGSQAKHNTAQPNLENHFANSIINMATGKTCEYWHLVNSSIIGHIKDVWETSFVNELSRLAQGVGTIMLDGSNTIFFTSKAQVPKDRNPTYGHLMVSI
jgi:hypothetical protein